MGVNGLYFDEGFGHQFLAINQRGRSSVELLTEQSRGATALYRSWRSAIGPNAFLSCESGSDVQARWIDLWHFGRPAVHLRYTHPDKLIKVQISRKELRQSVADAFLMGCPLLVRLFLASVRRIGWKANCSMFCGPLLKYAHNCAPARPPGTRTASRTQTVCWSMLRSRRRCTWTARAQRLCASLPKPPPVKSRGGTTGSRLCSTRIR